MDRIENDLKILYERIRFLEEKKRLESEKKVDSIKLLETILVHRKKYVEKNAYSKSIYSAKLYDQEKIAMLEPIIDILKDIQSRLTVLEKTTIQDDNFS